MSEKKESINFGKKKMWLWWRNKKMRQKGAAKLWASNPHLQKGATLFSLIRKALDLSQPSFNPNPNLN